MCIRDRPLFAAVGLTNCRRMCAKSSSQLSGWKRLRATTVGASPPPSKSLRRGGSSALPQRS
eukprot:6196392-Prorocentrum_lima.AAC.1